MTENTQILIIDSNASRIEEVSQILDALPYSYQVSSVEDALDNFSKKSEGLSLVLLSVDPYESEPFGLLKKMAVSSFVADIVVYSKEMDINFVIDACKNGARHCFFEPFYPPIIHQIIDKAMSKSNLLIKLEKIAEQRIQGNLDIRKSMKILNQLSQKRRQEGRPIYPKEFLSILPRQRSFNPEFMEKFNDLVDQYKEKIEQKPEKNSILIIEDDISIRIPLEDLLSVEYDVVAVGSAEEGIEAVEGQTFDLILLDIFLPGMNGNECLPILKKKSPSSEIIAMTGYKINEMVEEMLHNGATDFLVKSLSKSIIFSAVSQALELRYLKEVLNDIHSEWKDAEINYSERMALFSEIFNRNKELGRNMTWDEARQILPHLEQHKDFRASEMLDLNCSAEDYLKV